MTKTTGKRFVELIKKLGGGDGFRYGECQLLVRFRGGWVFNYPRFKTLDKAIEAARKIVDGFKSDGLFSVDVYEGDHDFQYKLFATWDACSIHRENNGFCVIDGGVLVQPFID